MYVTWHWLLFELIAVRAQVELLNVPPLPPSLQVTNPVGADTLPELVSLTVAVKVFMLPVGTVAEFGITVVFVLRLFTFSVEEPELLVCEESPE